VRTLKLVLAYDGGPFVGWQRQRHGASVQALVEDALTTLEGAPVRVAGAGRTDAGVHAAAQVASARVGFAHDLATVRRALNARLPPEIRVLDAADAGAGFHARFSARAKTYHYRLFEGPAASPFAARYAWHVPWPLDEARMDEAARRIVGEHDFAAFQSTGSNAHGTVRRVLESRVAVIDGSGEPPIGVVPAARLDGRVLVYVVRGTGFLRHMVRAIVGTLVEVGTGRAEPAIVNALFASRSRQAAGPTAPAHGLCLAGVEYAGDEDDGLRLSGSSLYNQHLR
jgi:tRNA pseudouridine38-40 synthase